MNLRPRGHVSNKKLYGIMFRTEEISVIAPKIQLLYLRQGVYYNGFSQRYAKLFLRIAGQKYRNFPENIEKYRDLGQQVLLI